MLPPQAMTPTSSIVVVGTPGASKGMKLASFTDHHINPRNTMQNFRGGAVVKDEGGATAGLRRPYISNTEHVTQVLPTIYAKNVAGNRAETL